MKKLLALLSILIILIGCSTDRITFEKNFILKESLVFDHKTLKGVNYYHYHFEEDSLITFFKDHKIIALNLKTGTEKLRINLPAHSEFVYRDHRYHNQDSIFICCIVDQYDMCILLMNSHGVVYNKWIINDLINPVPDGYFYIDARHSHPMILKKDILLFQASYRFKPGKTIDFQAPVEIAMNLRNSQISQIGDLPQSYKNGEFYGNHQHDYSRVLNDRGELVFSFPACHNLLVYDSSGFLLNSIDCQSNYIEELEPINEDHYKELSAIIDAYAYNAQYGDLIYDKYNKVYYRIALHKLDKFDENNNKSDVRKRAWSVMVLDENFNKTGEFLMPIGMYWKRFIFTKQGLILRKINNGNTNDFQLFTPCIS